MSADHSDSTIRNRISEDEAHRLLARAAELDARIGTSLSVAQLREIAAEAGIAPEAFEAALREYEAHDYAPAAGVPSANNERRVARHRLLDRLARHRVLAVFAILLGVAFATPGDLVFLTLVVSAPLYGLYELGIRVGRSRLRPPGTPPASPTGGADGTPRRTLPTAPDERTTRSLLLRTV